MMMESSSICFDHGLAHTHLQDMAQQQQKKNGNVYSLTTINVDSSVIGFARLFCLLLDW